MGLWVSMFEPDLRSSWQELAAALAGKIRAAKEQAAEAAAQAALAMAKARLPPLNRGVRGGVSIILIYLSWASRWSFLPCLSLLSF